MRFVDYHEYSCVYYRYVIYTRTCFGFVPFFFSLFFPPRIIRRNLPPVAPPEIRRNPSRHPLVPPKHAGRPRRDTVVRTSRTINFRVARRSGKSPSNYVAHKTSPCIPVVHTLRSINACERHPRAPFTILRINRVPRQGCLPLAVVSGTLFLKRTRTDSKTSVI